MLDIVNICRWGLVATDWCWGPGEGDGVRGEGGEPSLGGGGGVLGLPGWGCSLQFSAASASRGQPNNAHNHCLLFCSDRSRSTTELVSTRELKIGTFFTVPGITQYVRVSLTLSFLFFEKNA